MRSCTIFAAALALTAGAAFAQNKGGGGGIPVAAQNHGVGL